ncbi:aminotransferase class I/II-fold pyridoxal phosphate-dependent enzyme [Jannaschia pohangensis]|uniref:Aminotransferase n=1 Tax=Jannaschia pohangensis TaxID=390807 RepID=A0A1I3GWD6_9RHOB|nr:aminotransferase class I/II-fold pyridoxal phosphate-dependent enzyme [Jannaschia pohangensis]SFI27734.1 Aspartate/methionine/tyrosine aminotransferase [Jannaschia pohangensis]
MKIEPFGVEMWMNAHENNCLHNLAETCVTSLTLAELLQITGRNDGDLAELLPLKLTYGAIEGSDRLRDAIAALYANRTREDVMTCHGTAGANALVWQAMVGAGDHVVSLVPTYQQHVSIPESLGAEVTRLALDESDGWLPDPDRLAKALRPDTKVIALTNPNNPTGALIDRDGLTRIAEIADRVGAHVLVDEVYRGTEQDGGIGPSIVDIYHRGIATAGMSKAFSLAGLRLGWVVGPQDVLRAVSHHRDYSTISVGMIDEHLAALALEASDRILERSRRITRANLATLGAWIDAEPGLAWVRPAAGTTALVRYDLPMASEAFCLDLLAEEGVLFTPGAVMGVEGTLRIGFGNPPADLAAGLPKVSAFLARKRARQS